MLERLPGNLEGAGGCRDIVVVAAQGRCQEILLTGIHVGFQGLGAAGRNGAWGGLAAGNSFCNSGRDDLAAKSPYPFGRQRMRFPPHAGVHGHFRARGIPENDPLVQDLSCGYDGRIPY